ncbi:putative immunoglobulin-blocking virulence protein [Mycoplasma sp. 6243]|uniref:putative immunoglobulin-blocking virulence protein n=1 Tax=Mycoplasma sp. 6243 TaxID=3440865 RepID=UPI003EBD27D9
MSYKRKNFILLAAISVSLILSSSIASVVYQTSAQILSGSKTDLSNQDARLIPENKLNTNLANSSNIDNNLQKIKEQPTNPVVINIAPSQPQKEQPKEPIIKPENQPKQPKEPIIINAPDIKPPQTQQKPIDLQKPIVIATQPLKQEPIKQKPPVQKVESKPQPSTPVIVEQPKPIKQPTTPKPTQPITNTQYNTDGIGDGYTEINIANTTARAKVDFKVIPHEYSKQDIEDGIANPKGYQNVTTGKIISVEVTPQLIAADAKVAIDGINANAGKIADATDDSESENAPYILSKGFWTGINDRFGRIAEEIIRHKNDPRYLQYIKQNYRDIYLKRKFNSFIEEKVYVAFHLDRSKFTNLSQRAIDFLKKGYTLDPDNVFINENGELDSYGQELPPGFNRVTARVTRDNKYKRAFGYDDWQAITPGNLEEGNYPGWTKTDVTNEPIFSKYVNNTPGIKVYDYTRDDKSPTLRNQGYALYIDMNDTNAYQKTASLIKELEENKIQITSYRFNNLGKASAAQKYIDIFKLLPNHIPQLQLFFDASATNTSALIALKDKNIDELGLYTYGNPVLDAWSYNPWALNKVAWINTNDYNPNQNYKKNIPIATRIIFDTIAFDESNYLKNTSDPYKEINLGLRMVYWTRNNEPFFQGSYGSGLDPDTKEKDNSYPQGLDFSRVPEIKSLKGLIFSDNQKASNNKPRKIRRLKLYNNSQIFTMTADDINNAGFNENFVLNSPQLDSKITFSNGETNQLYISGNGTLTSIGLSELRTLTKTLYQEFASKPILVDKIATNLAAQLQQNGYNVQVYSDQDTLEIT